MYTEQIYDNIVSAHEARLTIAPAKYVMSSSKSKANCVYLEDR